MNFLKTYWRVLWALVVGVWLSISALREGQVLTVSDLAKVMGLALAALVSLHLAESFDLSLKFRKSRTDIKADLKVAIEEAERHAARIVEFKAQSDYADLFGDITGDLFSYNPHQFSHQALALDEKEIIDNMRRRFKDAAFSSARYLICIGDEYGERNFARFALRLRKVASGRAPTDDVSRKVKIKTSERPFVPEVTFHLQQKQGIDRAVVELRLTGLTIGASPVPRHYLVTGVYSLRTHFNDYFEEEWASAHEIEVATLLELVDKNDTLEQVKVKLQKVIHA